MADLGVPLARAPPMAKNFLNFMQFFTKFGKILCWRPPEGWRPLLRGIVDPPLRFENRSFPLTAPGHVPC